MKNVTIHTDGGCHGNPGPGAWAAVLQYGTVVKKLSGGVLATTNNRMELEGAINALSALKQPCEVEFYTDSKYVKNGVESWLHNWKKNAWRTAAKKPVKNEDLWRLLDAAVAPHRITWKWLKGHAGHELNEACDQLANEEIAKIKANNSSEQLHAALTAFNSAHAVGPSELFP